MSFQFLIGRLVTQGPSTVFQATEEFQFLIGRLVTITTGLDDLDEFSFNSS